MPEAFSFSNSPQLSCKHRWSANTIDVYIQPVYSSSEKLEKNLTREKEGR